MTVYLRMALRLLTSLLMKLNLFVIVSLVVKLQGLIWFSMNIWYLLVIVFTNACVNCLMHLKMFVLYQMVLNEVLFALSTKVIISQNQIQIVIVLFLLCRSLSKFSKNYFSKDWLLLSYSRLILYKMGFRKTSVVLWRHMFYMNRLFTQKKIIVNCLLASLMRQKPLIVYGTTDYFSNLLCWALNVTLSIS